MNHTCNKCGASFEGPIHHDENGWHAVCPKCGEPFDVSLPDKPIIMAFVDDSDPDKDCENFVDDFPPASLRTVYGFDSLTEFIPAWRKMSEKPDGMWYFLIADGVQFCSGACDPGDEEIIEEHFGISMSDFEGGQG